MPTDKQRLDWLFSLGPIEYTIVVTSASGRDWLKSISFKSRKEIDLAMLEARKQKAGGG